MTKPLLELMSRWCWHNELCDDLSGFDLSRPFPALDLPPHLAYCCPERTLLPHPLPHTAPPLPPQSQPPLPPASSGIDQGQSQGQQFYQEQGKAWFASIISIFHFPRKGSRLHTGLQAIFATRMKSLSAVWRARTLIYSGVAHLCPPFNLRHSRRTPVWTGWAAGGYPAPPLPPPPGQPPVPGQGNMGGHVGSQVNGGGQMPDQMGHYMGGHMGGVGGGMPPMGQMGGEQQQAMDMYQQAPVVNPAAVMGGPMPSMAGGMGHGHGGGGPGMNGSMGVMGGGGGFPVGGLVGGPGQQPQRPAKKVPDWLVQTLKEKEKQAEKLKKKEGVSLSTDVAATALSGGTGSISGYNLVHSPSPSPPGSPAAAPRTKPSWHDDDSDDDSADEVSPTRASREKRAAASSNGSRSAAAADGGGAGARNGAKPSGILKKGGAKKRGGESDDGGDKDEAVAAAAASSVMDDATRASFDREIRRLLTNLLKVGTANISHEVATSALEEAHHAAAAATAAAAPQAQQLPKAKRTEQREQKKAMGALIGGYGSESASDSEGDASPQRAAAPSATVSGDSSRGAAAAPGEAALDKSARSAAKAAAGGMSSSDPTLRKAPIMVGGKWQLPPWADPPHKAPLPSGLSIVVETIGPDLERVKTQELSYSTTVMGRFEEQCGFLVEDSSASRCHAVIL